MNMLTAFRTVPTTGIFEMTNEAYHADRSAVSASGLKEMLRSPAHFQSYLNTTREETAAMAFGTALHCAMLEPERFLCDYVVAIKFDRRTKEGKEAAAAFEAEHAGKTIISAEDYSAINTMVGSLMARSEVNLLLDGGAVEQSLFWIDEDTGVACKCRPDNLGELAILDVKTTQDASPEGFPKVCANWRYDLQAAFYIDGVAAVTGRSLPFVFLAAEKDSPYACAVYQASSEFVENGRRKYKAALRKLAECRETGLWHGYQPTGLIDTIDLPRWAMLAA